MARKTQISKEVILQKALEMLIRDGYDAINIKTLSQAIGCSTQPLVWHFENMEGLRRALSCHALDYANRQMKPEAENGVAAFEQVGRAYVRLAAKEPNLFRFLYLEGYSGTPANNFDALIADDGNEELMERISKLLGISPEAAGGYLMNSIIYTHGIAAMVATGIIQASEEEMMKLVDRAADAFLAAAGVDMNRFCNDSEL